MRYCILFFLLIILALGACKKDTSTTVNQTTANHIVAHDSISTNHLPQVLAGTYNGSEICYVAGTPGSTYPIDTINNLSWTVIIVSDSSISVNGSLAYIDVHVPAIYFNGTNAQGNSFGAGIDTSTHLMQVQTWVGNDVCIFDGYR